MNVSGKIRPCRVVVVGGGFAGVQLIHSLRRANVSVTLIDRRNHHLFQPLLYQVATTVLSTSEIAWPIRHLFRDRPEVETLLGEVTAVNRDGKAVILQDGTRIGYDILVLATGARHAYFGKDAWEPHAPGLKTLEDATTIRRRMLLALERAELEPDPEVRDALLTFAVVGAGPTGVELAGTLAELTHHVLPREFRRIDTRKARILLIEGGPRVLAAFSEPLSAYAKTALEKIGVEVLLGRAVTDCGPDGLRIGETPLACRTIIWAAGVQASPAAAWLRVEGDRAGRVPVGPDLSLPDDPDIFVIGDTALVKQQDGKPVPGLAPAAKQQGAYVAKVIKNRMGGKPAPASFLYRHQGNLATIGRRAAIIELVSLRLKGGLAWWLWGIAHIYFLIGTRSRFSVAWSWLWIFLSGQQSARLITQREEKRAPVGVDGLSF
ncbi:NAD(P)/FAD-dependent oxidoreductase [Brucella anthropi]|uniref:NADH:ubiquinone reductase (non-electrogenic) n=1 Tax=Brucella anthropi TaxID=529 RepID=A0A6I0D7Z9_BRUAN|nr:NAD(P)/FAD-dependent oxidoreductase [Brucella anthropi]KAB2764471.1 NAD(P)/FAD-dependent oxidoreductase [Brucella anthropi]KAB2778230.1 NAD(P)/FAD-dependent oxidoreductase [Brucella anthropi]